MTNSEHFEKNKISFAEAMTEFNSQKKIESFDTFLKAERVEWKFLPGDLVVLQMTDEVESCGWEHCIVMEILSHNSILYRVKFLTPDGIYHIGSICSLSKNFIEDNCIFY